MVDQLIDEVKMNAAYSDRAHWTVVLFGLAFFALTIVAAVKVALAENADTDGEDEKKRLQTAYRQTEYKDFDFAAYYKKAFQKRLVAYPLALTLAQMPLTVFYLILQIVGNAGQTMYHLDFPFYRFFLPAIFGYELTWQFWAGALIYAALAFVLFWFLPQRTMKSWMVKPSYVK